MRPHSNRKTPMKTAEYPQIGQVLPFIRHLNGVNQKGTGIILAIALDPNKRPIVHMEVNAEGDGLKLGEKINVDLKALEPTPEYEAAFIAAHKAIADIAEEGNGKVRELVTGYNQRVEEALSGVLGDPITFG